MFLTDRNIFVFDEIDSTNNYAKQLIADKVVEGTVVLAHYQQTGRGQQGNFWESEAKKNLLFSLIVYPRFLEAGKQFYLSKIASLALLKVVSSRLKDARIKWPNDLYVGEKKIAGMLIEPAIKGACIDSTVIGIGLNVNQEVFLSDAPNPVSMKNLKGESVEREMLLSEFLEAFQQYYEVLAKNHLQAIDDLYNKNLYRGAGWHLYRKDGIEFQAKFAGIGEFGQLRLEKKSGDIQEFMFKEVEFVL